MKPSSTCSAAAMWVKHIHTRQKGGNSVTIRLLPDLTTTSCPPHMSTGHTETGRRKHPENSRSWSLATLPTVQSLTHNTPSKAKASHLLPVPLGSAGQGQTQPCFRTIDFWKPSFRHQVPEQIPHTSISGTLWPHSHYTIGAKAHTSLLCGPPQGTTVPGSGEAHGSFIIGSSLGPCIVRS